MMDRDTYTKLMAGLLSGDPLKIRWANEKLYGACVGDGYNSGLVLVDAEQQVVKQNGG